MAARGEDRAVGRKGQGVDLGLVSLQGEQLLAGGDVPDPDDLAFARRDDVPAVGRERQAAELIRLAADGPDQIARGRVPELDAPLLVGRGEQRAVGRERDREDISHVAAELPGPGPVATSQSRTVASLDAEASVRPSGLKATEVRFLVWPVRTARVVFSATSQSRAVMSSLAVASHRPSGLKATERTQPVWPSKLATVVGCGVPEDDVGMPRLAGIQASGGEQPPVRAEGERRDRGRVGLPARQESAGGRVPELDRLTLVGVVAAGGQDLAVGRKGRGPGLGGVAGKRVGFGRRVSRQIRGPGTAGRQADRPARDETRIAAILIRPGNTATRSAASRDPRPRRAAVRREASAVLIASSVSSDENTSCAPLSLRGV